MTDETRRQIEDTIKAVMPGHWTDGVVILSAYEPARLAKFGLKTDGMAFIVYTDEGHGFIEVRVVDNLEEVDSE